MCGDDISIRCVGMYSSVNTSWSLKIVLNNTFAGSFSGSDKLKNADHVVSTAYRLDLSV